MDADQIRILECAEILGISPTVPTESAGVENTMSPDMFCNEEEEDPLLNLITQGVWYTQRQLTDDTESESGLSFFSPYIEEPSTIERVFEDRYVFDEEIRIAEQGNVDTLFNASWNELVPVNHHHHHHQTLQPSGASTTRDGRATGRWKRGYEGVRRRRPTGRSQGDEPQRTPTGRWHGKKKWMADFDPSQALAAYEFSQIKREHSYSTVPAKRKLDFD